MQTKHLLIPITLLLALLPLPAIACPNRTNYPNGYIRRDNNRCEGVDPTAEVSIQTSLELISFTAHTIPETWPNTLALTIPSPTEASVQMRAIGYRYRLDNLDMDSTASQRTFTWPTRILTNIPIPTQILSAIAKTPENLYYPVILHTPSPTYQFTFYSSLPARFTRAQIVRASDNEVIHEFTPTFSASGHHYFQWDSSNTPAGRYHFQYDAEIDASAPRTLSDREITFQHNPNWTR